MKSDLILRYNPYGQGVVLSLSTLLFAPRRFQIWVLDIHSHEFRVVLWLGLSISIPQWGPNLPILTIAFLPSPTLAESFSLSPTLLLFNFLSPVPLCSSHSLASFICFAQFFSSVLAYTKLSKLAGASTFRESSSTCLLCCKNMYKVRRASINRMAMLDQTAMADTLST